MVNRDSLGGAALSLESLDTKEVLNLLKFGAHAVLNTDAAGDDELGMSEAAIELIIDRTRDAGEKARACLRPPASLLILTRDCPSPPF